MAELGAHAEWADDERSLVGGGDESERLQLHDGLAEPERCEDGAAAALDGPFDNGALMREQHRVYVAGFDGASKLSRCRGFRFEELLVGGHRCCFRSSAVRPP